MYKSLITCAITLLATAGVSAQSVPTLINYQGHLTDAAGAALPTGDYSLTFRVFDEPTAGTLAWGPLHFDIPAGQPLTTGHKYEVPVVQGYFNVMLGEVDIDGDSILAAFNDPARYVEITVDESSGGVPILPRQQILTAPYAINAESVGGDALTYDEDGDGILVSGGQGALAVVGTDTARMVRLERTGTDPGLSWLGVSGTYAFQLANSAQIDKFYVHQTGRVDVLDDAHVYGAGVFHRGLSATETIVSQVDVVAERTLKMGSYSSPPFACTSQTAGSIYFDTNVSSGWGIPCFCMKYNTGAYKWIEFHGTTHSECD